MMKSIVHVSSIVLVSLLFGIPAMVALFFWMLLVHL
jgi:hypothetical protein